jgi:thiamine phosphate synthase YjbQ (UPF0047 family)
MALKWKRPYEIHSIHFIRVVQNFSSLGPRRAFPLDPRAKRNPSKHHFLKLTAKFSSSLRRIHNGQITIAYVGYTSSIITHRPDDGGSTSETSVDNYFTRQYIPEDKSELHTRRRENLKSHTLTNNFVGLVTRSLRSDMTRGPPVEEL